MEIWKWEPDRGWDLLPKKLRKEGGWKVVSEGGWKVAGRISSQRGSWVWLYSRVHVCLYEEKVKVDLPRQ
jgi:hypothetical protein